jgi:hypothetical protein
VRVRSGTVDALLATVQMAREKPKEALATADEGESKSRSNRKSD